MLSPMMVQYLVGLCCLRNDPDAVDVTIGDMVMDESAGKERDVDVTVTLKSEDGTVTAFKASEVKHEGKPLDVTTVEQLILKLSDMSKVTKRAIFSTSGYTDGACSKAASHGVDLYTLLPWDRPISQDFPAFPDLGKPEEFVSRFESSLLYWTEERCYFATTEGPSSFNLNDGDSLLSPDGTTHSEYKTVQDYCRALYFRSTSILSVQNPAILADRIFPCDMKIDGYFAGPAWPHTHTLDLIDDGVHVRLGDVRLAQIASATISGRLQWRRRIMQPEFKILERASDKKIFAGAAIAAYGSDDGRMLAIVFPEKSRELGMHIIQIPEKQRNLIRNLKILPPH